MTRRASKHALCGPVKARRLIASADGLSVCVLVIGHADFGKRARNKVDGVPRSSLHPRDDASAEFSRVLRSQLLARSDEESSQEDDPSYSAWEEGRQRRQARVAAVVECGECGVCGESNGDMMTRGELCGGQQIGQSTARQQLQILEQLRLKREQQSAGAGSAFPSNGESEMAELAGIGLFFVQRDEGGKTVVDEVVGGGAAEASGRIMAGDVLLCVEGHDVQGLDLTEIRQLIVGRPGSSVTLEFSRRLPSVRHPRLALDDSSDEDAMSGDDAVRVLRRRQRGGVGAESSGEDMETYFVVRLVRAVQLSAHVESEEGPSPASHSVEPARKLPLTLSTSRAQAAQGSGKAVLPGEKRQGVSRHRKVETDGEADAASNSSARSLSHRSTELANLSGHSSGEDDCGAGGGALSSPVTPCETKMTDKPVSVEQVCAFLVGIELGEYEGIFFANKIDGDMLQDLQEQDLETDFGMTNKYHRRRLLSKRAACATARPLAGPMSAASAASTAEKQDSSSCVQEVGATAL